MALESQTSGVAISDSQPLEEIDVSDPALYMNDTWQAPFARLRREDPVHYCAESPFGPYWSVTRYDDIMAVELDHSTYSSASRVNYFVAGSRVAARRILKHYSRESDVIPPPVDVDAFLPSGKPPEDFYLVVSRLVLAKHIVNCIEDRFIFSCCRIDYNMDSFFRFRHFISP